MALTVEQRGAFWRDGYLLYPELLSEAQIRALRERTEQIAAGVVRVPEEFRGERILKEEPRIGPSALQVADPIDALRKIEHPSYHDAVFSQVSASDPVIDCVADLLGTSDIKLLTDQIFVKPPRHGSAKEYHQDAASWPYIVPQQWITCWIALDPATLANGCLRYLPGSHRLGLIQPRHVPQLLTVDVLGQEVAVEVPAGGCLFHHCLILHYSGPNSTPMRRRGWAIHYMGASSRDLSAPDETIYGPGKGDYLSIHGRTYPGCV
jgi:ectoine hydroxylase-related dioxygenase (phytanoyl-CoA dioxygenase family)